MRPAVLAFAKLGISAALIALVLRAFDVHGLGVRLNQIDAVTAGLAAVSALAVVPLHALRWRIALVLNGNHLPFARMLAIVWIGHFFNQTLPSSVGGDAARIWCAYRAGLSGADAAVTVILDRMISLLGLLALSLCGLPWLLQLLPDPAARSSIVLVITAGIGGFLALVSLSRLPPFLAKWRIARVLPALIALARRLIFSPSLLHALAYSVAGFVMFTCIVFVLVHALGARVTLGECLLLVPPVLLVSAIPVSVAGWGLREGAMVIALGLVGVEPTAAFGVSVLFGLVLAAVSLPGAGFWLAGGYSAKNLSPAMEIPGQAAIGQTTKAAKDVVAGDGRA